MTVTPTPGSSQTPSPSVHSRTARLTFWLYAIFFLSGISGLMYEVVWVRMLTRVLGNTVYATSTVLAAFMAGLAVGSFLIGRFIDRVRPLLVTYALLEFGIGLSAVVTLGLPLRLTPLYQRVYELAGESRGWLTISQVVLSLIVLVVPTALMGATLPTLCAFGTRHLQTVGRCVGTFYALNTLGGVLGVVASGFVLLGELGERNTVFVGVALNCAAGAGTLVLRRLTTEAASSRAATRFTTEAAASGVMSESPDEGRVSHYSARVRAAVVVCFAISGFAALANEVLWSRLLTLHQGTSIYGFSAMLAVMLAGMGIGSYSVGRFTDRWTDPLRVLALLELTIGLAGAAALHVFDLMGAPVRPSFESSYHARIFYLVLAPAILIGPLGLLWGALFPVAARCYTQSIRVAGRSIAELYAWNTVGCIAGPLAAGFVLIPLLGTSLTAAAVVAISLIVGLLLLAVHPHRIGARGRLSECMILAVASILLATTGDPYYKHVRRRMLRVFPDSPVPYLHIEEAAGTTTAFGSTSGNPREKLLWVNGAGMTELITETKLMAHLPISLAEDPRDVLVICFGMGTTLRSASRYEELAIWGVEMMPGVLRCFGFFHPDGPELLRRPNIHVTADDGRNFMLVHPQQFDVITVDPAPPLYSAGTVNLYSREFFELCRSRLRPGGVMCLWVPPSNYSETKMIVRTFLDVFDQATVWSGMTFNGLYLIGSLRPIEGVAERVSRIYDRDAAVQDLTEWGDECDRPEKLLALFIADADRLKPFLQATPSISDDRPYTEFPLWRAIFAPRNYERTLDGFVLRAILGQERRE